jgi:hypothetical protein
MRCVFVLDGAMLAILTTCLPSYIANKVLIISGHQIVHSSVNAIGAKLLPLVTKHFQHLFLS